MCIRDRIDTIQSNLKLFQGIMYLETNNLKAAKNSFRTIEQKGSAYSIQAAWYLALIAIKEGNNTIALKQLNNIKNNALSFKVTAIDELLTELNKN